MKKFIIWFCVTALLLLSVTGCSLKQNKVSEPPHADKILQVLGKDLDTVLTELEIDKSTISYNTERRAYVINDPVFYLGGLFHIYFYLTQGESGVLTGIEYLTLTNDEQHVFAETSCNIRDALAKIHGTDKIYPTRQMSADDGQTHPLDVTAEELTKRLYEPGRGIALTWCLTEDVAAYVPEELIPEHVQSICIRYTSVSDDSGNGRWLRICYQLDAFALSQTQTP